MECKTKVIPVIKGATGTISESFRKYVSNIPGKHEVKELQKTAILGTAHILRKVLIEKYSRFDTKSNDISTMNSNNRIAVTLYSQEDLVYLKHISINTLHKGDDDDDDGDDDNNNIFSHLHFFHISFDPSVKSIQIMRSLCFNFSSLPVESFIPFCTEMILITLILRSCNLVDICLEELNKTKRKYRKTVFRKQDFYSTAMHRATT